MCTSFAASRSLDTSASAAAFLLPRSTSTSAVRRATSRRRMTGLPSSVRLRSACSAGWQDC